MNPLLIALLVLLAQTQGSPARSTQPRPAAPAPTATQPLSLPPDVATPLKQTILSIVATAQKGLLCDVALNTAQSSLLAVNREMAVAEKPLLEARRLEDLMQRTIRTSSAYAALYQQRTALQPEVDKATPAVRRLDDQRGQINGEIKKLTDCGARARADLDALITVTKAP